MNQDVPNGLAPIDKMPGSADVKSTHLQLQKMGEEAADKSELVPCSDRIQFSQKTESPQSQMMPYLTTDKNLNEYIHMLKQSEELETNLSCGSPFISCNSDVKSPQSSQKSDFLA